MEDLEMVLTALLIFQAIILVLILAGIYVFMKFRDRLERLEVAESEVKRLRDERWLFLEVNGAIKNGAKPPHKEESSAKTVEKKSNLPPQ